MTQKLVVIHLKADTGDLKNVFIGDPVTKEYLTDYTKSGWRIVSVSTAGASENDYCRFLVAVVLEKADEL